MLGKFFRIIFTHTSSKIFFYTFVHSDEDLISIVLFGLLDFTVERNEICLKIKKKFETGVPVKVKVSAH
jgi:hypothetical protein